MFSPFGGNGLKSNIPPAQNAQEQEQKVEEPKTYLTKNDKAPEGLSRADILVEYGYMESNIPMDHIYWTLT